MRILLLVDDDSSIVQALLPALKALPGQEVHVALTGEKALERAPAVGGIDLLITDVVMGGIDGFTLREQLAAWYPDLRTIFISGYDLTDYGERIGNSQVLAKPFGPEVLIAAVQREIPQLVVPAVAAPVEAVPAEPSRTPEEPEAAAAPLPPSPAVEAAGGDRVGDALLGQMIGGYTIVSYLGEGRWGSVYGAVQTSINRPVGLKLLDPVRAQDESQKERFIADARAKAHVQHAGVLSVYEAGSADNWVFYTHEYVDGQNLEEMAAAGRKIDEPTALKLLKTAADGLAYFSKNNVPHTPFEASDIFLGVDGQPRLSNLATQLADQPVSAAREIESLGRALLSVVGTGPAISTMLRALLGRTLPTNPKSIRDWDTLLMGVKALEPKIVPLEAAKISAQERAAQATLEKALRQQKRAFLVNVIALISLLLFAVGAVYFVWFRSNAHDTNEQVHIPAGEFISGTGVPSKTGEFWIDKYEVSIGEYAKFVQWIDAHPGDEHAFDHSGQPPRLGHIPDDWQIYYGQAKRGGAAHSVPISLNSPVMMVTWWDAYAYAKWLDRELPTEWEWEKAARGTKGNRFPWGEEADPKKANTGADLQSGESESEGGDRWVQLLGCRGRSAEGRQEPIRRDRHGGERQRVDGHRFGRG